MIDRQTRKRNLVAQAFVAQRLGTPTISDWYHALDQEDRAIFDEWIAELRERFKVFAVELDRLYKACGLPDVSAPRRRRPKKKRRQPLR